MDVFDLIKNILIGTGSNLAATAIQEIIKKIFSLHPNIESMFQPTSQSSNFDKAKAIYEMMPNVLEVLAKEGTIAIDGSIIQAIKSAQFDHGNGTIRIKNTSINAPILLTGGTGCGRTTIKDNVELRSSGTDIKIGHGYSIVMTGNSSIKQT